MVGGILDFRAVLKKFISRSPSLHSPELSSITVDEANRDEGGLREVSEKKKDRRETSGATTT